MAYKQIGIAGGIGSPTNLKGVRINYQQSIRTWDRVSLLFDASYAHWVNNRSNVNNLDVFAIAPFLVWHGGEINEFHPFVHLSIGVAKKSSRVVGNIKCGSKWTFQDILGLGFQINKNVSVQASYMHYSNGSIFPPNPGIDILPMISVLWRF